MRTVAALYVDARGVYGSMDGVDPWDVERDATGYPGPHPVVAHPPCGPWGQLRHLCRHQRMDLAPRAVGQVLRWGGVLEHPRNSRLWDLWHAPPPGGLPQRWGRWLVWTVDVEQVRWGHACRKPTRLLCVGVPPLAFPRHPPPRHPTHVVSTYNADRDEKTRMRHDGLLVASGPIRRRTPLPFAEFLVGLAREVTPDAW